MARAKRPRDAVQFTLESAERIASVVRAAETAPAAASPLTFDRRLPDRVPKMVRAATFTGSWVANSMKVVTFSHAPTATANVTNLVWPISSNSPNPRVCIVGKEGANWWLVAPELEEQQAIFVTQTQSLAVLTNVTIEAWIDPEFCDVIVAKTNHTTSIRVISQTSTASFLRPKA